MIVIPRETTITTTTTTPRGSCVLQAPTLRLSHFSSNIQSENESLGLYDDDERTTACKLYVPHCHIRSFECSPLYESECNSNINVGVIKVTRGP